MRDARHDRGTSRAEPRFAAALPIILTILAAVGCSDGRPERVKVTGQVLIDGEPLTHGYVRFVPKGARPSSSMLDDQGRFTLTCFGDEDGAIPGVHRVEVNGSESISGTKKFWHAPKKYASYRFSQLTEEITESTESLVINLSWDGGKPFMENLR